LSLSDKGAGIILCRILAPIAQNGKSLLRRSTGNYLVTALPFQQIQNSLENSEKGGTIICGMAGRGSVPTALSKNRGAMSNIIFYSGFQPMSLFGLFRLMSLPGLLRASPVF